MSIKSWAEDDRPREKMLQKGRAVLTDVELVAILIGSGTPSESAVDISKRILASVSNDLNKLGRLTIRDLMKFNGIGQARAIAISSAMELGRRRKESQTNAEAKITSSKDAFEILLPHLSDLNHEEFFALLLNRSNRFIEVIKISQGGVAGTVADTKIIFKAAIDRLASSVILAHNHPSGNRNPSQADLKLTKGLVEAGKLLEVSVLDHLIIADKSYFSLADEGLM
ncbi:MAG: DNA repair protein RadC [Flavobacteriales bacterium]|nr:DNA repair protein RadC [Flavobacteriales bacterium]